MSVSATVEGVKSGDKLIWVFGGAQLRKGRDLAWSLNVMVQPKFLEWGFIPEECLNNKVETAENIFFVSRLHNFTIKLLYTKNEFTRQMISFFKFRTRSNEIVTGTGSVQTCNQEMDFLTINPCTGAL